jgi:hypothetical protein
MAANPRELIDSVADAIVDYSCKPYQDRKDAAQEFAGTLIAAMSDMVRLGMREDKPAILHTGAELTRAGAIEIARKWAAYQKPSYYTEPFEPHDWVVTAIIDASRRETIPCPVNHDKIAEECRESGYRQGLAAALQYGRQQVERLLKVAMRDAMTDMQVPKLPDALQSAVQPSIWDHIVA